MNKADLDGIPTDRFVSVRKMPVVVKACRAGGQEDIHTLEGVMRAEKGDVIIKGVRGELYPCKPDIFRETYQLVTSVVESPELLAVKKELETVNEHFAMCRDACDQLKKQERNLKCQVDITKAATHVVGEIAIERLRQITVEGWDHGHDDEHDEGALADAAAFYASVKNIGSLWPWDPMYIKNHPRRRQLVIAAALLVAEIERMDRSDS